MQAPENAGKGMAKVGLSFTAWKPGEVQPAAVEVPMKVIEVPPSPQPRPDGKPLASGSAERTLRLWDMVAKPPAAARGK